MSLDNKIVVFRSIGRRTLSQLLNRTLEFWVLTDVASTVSRMLLAIRSSSIAKLDADLEDSGAGNNV